MIPNGFFRVELRDWPRKHPKFEKIMSEIIWALDLGTQKEHCHEVIYLKKEKQQGLKYDLTSKRKKRRIKHSYFDFKPKI